MKTKKKRESRKCFCGSISTLFQMLSMFVQVRLFGKLRSLRLMLTALSYSVFAQKLLHTFKALHTRMHFD